MGGVFDQWDLESAARCGELADTGGKTGGVTCQDGGNGRPRCAIDCVDAHVSVVGRHRRHPRPESSRDGAEEHGLVLERGHEDAIAGGEEELESEVNGKSTGRHEPAFASDTGLQYRLDATLDLLAHEPSFPRDTASSWQMAALSRSRAREPRPSSPRACKRSPQRASPYMTRSTIPGPDPPRVPTAAPSLSGCGAWVNEDLDRRNRMPSRTQTGRVAHPSFHRCI